MLKAFLQIFPKNIDPKSQYRNIDKKMLSVNSFEKFCKKNKIKFSNNLLQKPIA